MPRSISDARVMLSAKARPGGGWMGRNRSVDGRARELRLVGSHRSQVTPYNPTEGLLEHGVLRAVYGWLMTAAVNRVSS